MSTSERDRGIVRALCAWFQSARRDLPWRPDRPDAPRNAYHALVSELMLQQTQVSRVIERFRAFIDRFPTLESLADADQADVLALWSGLGYYRRARFLHRAAREALERFGGLPEDAASLETLPGVGRYTAGAVASIVHNDPTPIVDGNVARVLLRLDGIDAAISDGYATEHCWSRAALLVQAAHRSRTSGVRPGVMNEAMMELGALICTPAAPACGACPLATRCRAHATDRADTIPRPKKAPKKRDLFIACLRIHDKSGRYLLEQRPASGLWAGLWQPPAIESDRPINQAIAAGQLGLANGSMIEDDCFVWQTSHRAVSFIVYRADAPPDRDGLRWVHPDDFGTLAIGSAQRRALLGTT
ncbi:MAG: A/G-specific adenine glycosylase [Planctomycetota bacterium]